ncbi:unnamed protein product [Candidula unifasciata]|uniref:Uncharacterized protein n=1 Tax=Candidula unifasciata TaxID=100452 RepID=A0A8S3YXX7_9EUPU|nr:unnamed protein product [Candidula unifasciata]
MTEVPDGIKFVTDTDVFIIRGRPCELSAFSFVPPNRRNIPKERNYFNATKKEHYPGSRYDRLSSNMHMVDYNKHIHRDDREHAKLRGLAIYDEEVEKKVPTLSSSIYGHWLNLQADHPDRKHVHIGHVESEFYRRNGVELSSELKP